MNKLPPSAQQRQKNADPIKDEWRTPQLLWDNLNSQFHFGLDAAASEENAKVPFYFTQDMDALSLTWAVTSDPIWCNPPFSRKAEFVAKAEWEAHHNRLVVVMLLPAVPDVKWFHQYVIDKAHTVLFFQGRVQYESPLEEEKNGCTFPSMIVCWNGKYNRAYHDRTVFGSISTSGISTIW